MTERTCILTRDSSTPTHLIRLALAPDGRVLPDVRAKAPGRGAWIGVTAAELAEAQAKGKLRGALARSFKTGTFTVPDDLPALIATALERNALDRLGLESRAGMVLTGSERIVEAARKGRIFALYHASDASEDGRRRLAQAWRVGSDREGSDLGGLVLPVSRPILSMALGRENVVHIGVIDRMAAGRLGEALDRWRRFIGPDPVEARQGDTLMGALDSASCATAAQGASAPGLSGRVPAVTTHEEFE